MRCHYSLFIFGFFVLAGIVTGLVIFLLSYEKATNDILVNTSTGTIRGFKSDDGDYIQFLGVPYAMVNKSNPFGDSLPHPKLEGIYDANNDSVYCPQGNNALGEINCLQMNIFVPKSINAKNQLPVMFWIHGGGFSFGAKAKRNFGPKFLVNKNVILVTINYRLHVYGFMCLDIPEVPGNQGLKDQVLALRWLKENIKAFGGDFNRITPFGISCGAHSIDFHILSENEILFNRAILQSGGSLSATVNNNHDKRAPIKIAQQLGFNTTSLTEAISYLAKVDSRSVRKASNDLKIDYKPCAEKSFKNVKPFITKHWVNTPLTPKVKNMTIMAGFSEHELLHKYNKLKKFNNTGIIADKLKLLFNFDDKKLMEMVNKIHSFYFGGKETTNELIMASTYFDSDITYIYPVLRSINKYLKSGVQNVFYYMFSYNGGRNLEKILENVTIGSAVHSDEWGYLFDYNKTYAKKIIKPADGMMIARMTALWTNFAKYRDPTPRLSHLLPVKWEPIKNKTYNYYKIDHKPTLNQSPNPERMAFWDQFYAINKEYEKDYDNRQS